MSKTEDFNKTAYMTYTANHIRILIRDKFKLAGYIIPDQKFEPRVLTTSNIRWEEIKDKDSNHSKKSRNSFASFYENSSIATYL